MCKNVTSTFDNKELIELLNRTHSGDKQAFHTLYQLTAGKLNGIAYRITRNVDSANEVLQEAFIQIWEKSEQYCASQSEVFTWLTATVRYRAYDRLRYDARRHSKDTVEYNEEIQGNADNLRLNEPLFSGIEYSEQALNSCLEQLEQQHKQSILMAYLYGYSREEIASHFNTPMNTIKSWVRRGLKRLKLCLSD